MNITYRSPQLAGPGRGGLWVKLDRTDGFNSFWALTIAGKFQGFTFMDDFGFAQTVTPTTFFSLS